MRAMDEEWQKEIKTPNVSPHRTTNYGWGFPTAEAAVPTVRCFQRVRTHPPVHEPDDRETTRRNYARIEPTAR